jgi:hypothetical protein
LSWVKAETRNFIATFTGRPRELFMVLVDCQIRYSPVSVHRISYPWAFLPTLMLLLLGGAFTAFGTMGEYFVLMELYQKHGKRMPLDTTRTTIGTTGTAPEDLSSQT